MSQISEETLKHLFDLARIDEEKDKEKKEKLLKDLSKILDYFNQLQKIDTSKIEPVSGGTFLTNISRDDKEKRLPEGEREEQREKSVKQFSKKEREYLKIPPVF